MHLLDLSPQSSCDTGSGVPDWMLGTFRRRCISLADGTTDAQTRVYWMQSRGLTIDLRLPLLQEQLAAPLADLGDPHTLTTPSDLEGWYAHTQWNGRELSWNDGDSYQLHDRWPEPARLHRVGNCMMEFAPSGAYVEDWRLQESEPGPLIGLELLGEKDLASGITTPRRGALLVCARHAGLVLGRRTPLPAELLGRDNSLRQRLLDPSTAVGERARLLDFETSIGQGHPRQGYRVIHALQASRMGEPLVSLEGFAPGPRSGTLRQRLSLEGREIEREFRIDTWLAEHDFTRITAVTNEARAWAGREARTLTRYTRAID